MNRTLWLVAVLVVGGAGLAFADISGVVLDGATDLPIAGARVHLQADPSSPVVITGADGTFDLPVNPAEMVMVTAGLVYDRDAAVNYGTGGTLANNGQTGVTIRLFRIPSDEDPNYQMWVAQALDCGNCHEDQLHQWQESNHATAGTDEWVRDLYSGDGTPGGSAGYVFVDTHDPEDSGFCSTCHHPMEDVFDPGNVRFNEVTSAAGLEGVGCVACHQMDSVNGAVSELHLLGNATYRFPDDPIVSTSQFVWGPLDDVTFSGMKASYAPVFSEALFCASCHEYNRPGTSVPGQTPFTEWLASPYSVPGPNFRSCQDCHMPEEDGPGYLVDPIGNPPLRPAEQRHRHEMIGATEATLQDSITLSTSVFETDGGILVTADVANVGSGHSFPTGVSIRNAMVVVSATWNGIPLSLVSGPTIPFWADDNVPGKQDGDYAGDPGKGFARVLEGRINDQGPVVRPVLFIDGEAVHSETRIPSGTVDRTELEFAVPPGAQAGDTVVVEARLLYRRAWRGLAVTKGWSSAPQGGPIEIEVAATYDAVELTQGGAGVAIPTTGPYASAILIALLALTAVIVIRRTMAPY
jgi:hypothetical protein